MWDIAFKTNLYFGNESYIIVVFKHIIKRNAYLLFSSLRSRTDALCVKGMFNIRKYD